MRIIRFASSFILIIIADFLIFSCEKKPDPPLVTTQAVSEISYTSASSGGSVTDEGGSPLTARGICWNTTVEPTIYNFKTAETGGLGSFTGDMTQLSPNTKYYVRAYATNVAGTSYGNQVSFTTLEVTPATLTTTAVTLITQTSAVSGGNITSENGGTVTERGVCWSTSQNPSILHDKTSDGKGSGTFTSTLTSLTGNTTYYVRAYATNSAGTEYGTQVSFKTSPAPPTLSTSSISSIKQTTASSGGVVSNDGGAAVTAQGVCWSTTPSPTVELTTKTSDALSSTTFTSSISGLTPGIKYYVRAYATNSTGTGYGNELSFTTSPATLPTLTTTAVTAITGTTATSGGNITSDGGATISARGVCWSTTTGPTVSLSTKTSETGTTGSFASSVTELSVGTIYYLRAYATNSVGTAYGLEINFTTYNNDAIKDVDNNYYNIVTIGNQIWQKENLKTTKYNDGTPLVYITDNTIWFSLSTGAYCDYANDPSNSVIYGKMYNWYVAGSSNGKNLCPTGWHVPTDSEWTTLINYLGGESIAGGKLKESGTTHWLSPNTGATNESGFTGLPGGDRYASGPCFSLWTYGIYWSTTSGGFGTGWSRELIYSGSNVTRSNRDARDGASIRCLKD